MDITRLLERLRLVEELLNVAGRVDLTKAACWCCVVAKSQLHQVMLQTEALAKTVVEFSCFSDNMTNFADLNKDYDMR